MHRTTTLHTADGQCPTHLFQPDNSDGPWPAVLVYMDGRGIRPALFELAERIASGGYFVLLPDLFYRLGPYEAPTAQAFSDPALRQRWLGTYIASASKANVRKDTETFLSFLSKRSEVRGSTLATTGYCMGGALSLLAAAHFPDRVVAAASYHGGNLASDAEDSPHRLASQIRARVYVAGAVEDPSFPDEQKQRLIDAFTAARTDALVETYAGAKHGWVPSDSAVYDREASERHYRTLFALLSETLGK